MAEEVSNVQEAIDRMKDHFNVSAAEGMTAVYQFDLTGDGGAKYALAIDNGKLNVSEGSHGSPNITITMAANDYVAMANGKLNPQMAFMTGKLKISGDMGLAMKMERLFPTKKAQ